MAVAAVTAPRSEAAEYARDARLARFAALVLDGVFLSVINALVNGVYGVTVVTSGYFSDSGVSYLTTTQTIPTPVLVLLDLGYFVVLEAMFGATLGKQLMRVKVVRLDGTPLTAGAVIVRNVLRIVDFLPLAYVLGGILVLTTAGAQRLGDVAGGTAVVYRHRARAPGATRTSDARARLVLVVAVLTALLFSAGFDYFGRPPLFIQGLYNERRLLDLASYSLGQPTWTPGSVTYPIDGRTATASCTGWIQLNWYGLAGWQMGSAELNCPPS